MAGQPPTLQLLHVDSTGSRTWFLDSCGVTTHPERRLLLTNHDLGVPLTGGEVQTGLNFADSCPELFVISENGLAPAIYRTSSPSRNGEME